MAVSVEVSAHGVELARYQRLLDTLGRNDPQGRAAPKASAPWLKARPAAASATRRPRRTAHPGRPGRRTMPRPATVTRACCRAMAICSTASNTRCSGAARVGSALAYAGVHQDGFSGAVRVPAHIRRITQAFGKALAFPVYQSVGRSPARWRSPAPVPGPLQ